MKLEHNIEVYLQIWKDMKPHLIGGNIDEAADDFLRVLIEHGADAEEIATYALDAELKVAIQEYVEIEEDFSGEEDQDEYEYSEDDS